MSSSLSPADSGTTSKAEPGLAKGVQFDYNQLLRHHESESADIPTWAVRLSRQTVGKRSALEWMDLLEDKLGENPKAADVPRVIAEIFAQEELADEDPALAATGLTAESELDPALVATSAPATDQPQSEFGAKSAEGFDLDASQVDSSVGRHGASPIFEIRSGNKQPGSSSSEKSGIEQEQYDFNLITGEEIDSEIVSRVNDATDAALLTRRTNPTSEFAGAANRVLASELKHPGSTRKSMDLRLAGSLGDTFATLASDLEIGTLDARSRPGRGRNPNRDETLIAVSQVFVNKLLNHINGSISGVVSHLLENSADGDTYLPSLRKLASGVIQHKSKSDQDHISQEEVNELYAFLNLNEDLQPFLNNRPAKDIGINLSYIASRLVNELEKRDARKIEQVLDKLLPADGDINDRRLAKIFIRGERDDDVDFDIVNQLDKNDLAPPNGNARRWEELVNNIGTNMAERRVFGDDYSVTLLASPKIARLSIPSNIIKVRVDSDLEQGSSKRGYWLTTIGSMVALSTAVLVASANRSSSDVNSPEFRGAHDVIAKIDELSEKIDNKSSEQ